MHSESCYLTGSISSDLYRAHPPGLCIESIAQRRCENHRLGSPDGPGAQAAAFYRQRIGDVELRAAIVTRELLELVERWNRRLDSTARANDCWHLACDVIDPRHTSTCITPLAIVTAVARSIPKVECAIVAKHQGHLSAKSTPGAGTVVTGVRRAAPEAAIVVLSGFGPERLGPRASAEVSAHLPKTADLAAVRRTLREAGAR